MQQFALYQVLKARQSAANLAYVCPEVLTPDRIPSHMIGCTCLPRCLFVALLGSHAPTYKLNNEAGVLDGLTSFYAPTSVLGEEDLHNW